MKHRTNRQRAERKHIKAIALKEANATKKQIHIEHHIKHGYSTIMQLVRQKTSLITILNAHARKGIAKISLFPNLLWNNGTYVKAIHGELKTKFQR